MANDYVYTYGDIIVSDYEFVKILNLKIDRKLNEHAKLYLTGIIDDSKGDAYVENVTAKSVIKVSVKAQKGGNKDLFQGIITNISINSNSDVRILNVEALSQTFLMDIKKKNRSFQNESSKYSDVINTVNSDYGNITVQDDVTKASNIDTFVVQYKETDWEFIKRIASYFNSWIVPECQLDCIKYSIGKSGVTKTYDLNEVNYSIKKEVQEFKVKDGNGVSGLDDKNLITYEVVSHQILNLCDSVKFKGRNLYVYEAVIEVCDSVFLNKYKLRDEKGMKIPRIYNNQIVGLSLNGVVSATQKDEVQVKLDIDGGKDNGSRWFPYSTVFSSEDGTGWYCMPEINDAIRLYFPDNVEKNAYVISSVNLQSSDTEKRSDPSVKSLSTKDGKQLVMKENEVNLIGGSGMMIKMTDDGGIEIISDKKIILDAKEDIEIHGEAKVLINGKEGVDLTQKSSQISIKDDVTLNGGKVKME